jgi:hypothetical protein
MPTTAGPTNTPITPTPTRTPTPMPEKACGDVNDNGSVDSVDALLVLQYVADLLQTLPNMPSADVDDNGSLTSIDAALILQVQAGLIPLGTLDCG